jgi:hypothetical protein
MATRLEKGTGKRPNGEERVVNHPDGLVKRRKRKVDTTLTTRKGLINGPPVAKQDPGAATGSSKGRKRPTKGLLRR